MSFLEFTEDKNFPPQSEGTQAVTQHSKRNYLAALAWAVGGLLVAGVLLYIAAPKQVSQPRQLSLTTASQTETPQVIAKNVEDIQAGDVVVSYDEATGEQVFNRVVETYKRTSYHLRFIETRSLETGEVQTFETTDEHPFWKVDIGWVDAGKLQPGDQLLQSNDQISEVVSTRYEAHPEGVTVYNFQVADAHCYYVSAPTTRGPPILVHNADNLYGSGANNVRKLSSKAKDILNGNDVRVKTIKEADALLKEALPDARKVTGTGPGQSGPPDWTKFKGKDPDGIYHKDYHFDPDTGRIYGHGKGNPHGDTKHINIKLPDGRKVTIIVEPN